MQESIKLGRKRGRADLEADEVNFRKEHATYQSAGTERKRIRWTSNYIGCIDRADPSSLILDLLQPRFTLENAPGPGPITLGEWRQFQQRHLTNAKAFMHTDAARAYRYGTAKNLAHTWTTHAKKKMPNGRWMKPAFAKNGRVLTKEAGSGLRTTLPRILHVVGEQPG